MSQHKPTWMEEEESRAEVLETTGATTNDKAPKLERVVREPNRMQKAFYIQEKHSRAFERLVFEQKQSKGKKAPALAEEAIEIILEKYGVEL